MVFHGQFVGEVHSLPLLNKKLYPPFMQYIQLITLSIFFIGATNSLLSNCINNVCKTLNRSESIPGRVAKGYSYVYLI